MPKQKTNGITLDGLALMVAKGFEHTASDLDIVKQDVSGLKQDVIEVKQKVSRLDYRIEEMHEILIRFEEGDILDLQKRIKILERTVRAMSKYIETAK